MFLSQKLVSAIEKKRNSFLNRLINYADSFYKKIRKTRNSPSRKLIVGILITEKCNLNCAYCYEKNKTNKTIILSKMQEIIFHVMTAKSIWTDVEFRLLGGEPFIASKLIREAVEWTFTKTWTKRCSFKITTNGTLLDESMKEWLRQYSNKICVVLSLDGPIHIHNKNRNDSYSNIDFGFFRKTWPNQPVKMTVSKDTISELFNSVVYIQNCLGLNVSFSLAGGIGWDKKDLEIFEEEQKKILMFYREKRYKLPLLYNIDLARILYPRNSTRQCGIGRNVVAYDTDGNAFPCYLFLPNVLGQKNIPQIKDFADDSFLVDDYCKKCVIENICPTCYGFNFIERGKANMRDHGFCSFYKSIIKYSALFKMDYYSKQFYLTRSEQKEIDSILFLDKKLFMSEKGQIKRNEEE